MRQRHACQPGPQRRGARLFAQRNLDGLQQEHRSILYPDVQDDNHREGRRASSRHVADAQRWHIKRAVVHGGGHAPLRGPRVRTPLGGSGQAAGRDIHVSAPLEGTDKRPAGADNGGKRPTRRHGGRRTARIGVRHPDGEPGDPVHLPRHRTQQQHCRQRRGGRQDPANRQRPKHRRPDP